MSSVASKFIIFFRDSRQEVLSAIRISSAISDDFRFR